MRLSATRNRHSERMGGGVMLVAGSLACLGLAACKSEHAYQGPRHDILASYNFRTLTCSVERDVRVPAVIAAAEVTLRQRGYSINSSRTTEESGEIEAEPFDADILESVIVKARQDRGLSTKIDVRIEPLGDQVKSRSILDGILSNLGL